MNEKSLKLISIAALLISAIVTVWAMFQTADWSVDLGTVLFALWAISPYICFFFADSLLRKIVPNSKMYFASCLIAILLLISTLGLYGGTLNSISSTDSLKFLFVPIYLYLGSFTLLIGNLIFWLFRRKFQRQP